jgi:dynein light intermediate chain 1
VPESEVVSSDFTCPAACSVFIVEDLKHEQLLVNRLQNLDLQYCVAVVCLDLKAPWTMLDDLTKWFEMLRRISSECLQKLPVHEQDRLREGVKSAGSKEARRKGVDEGVEVADTVDGMAEMLYNLGFPLVVVGTRSDAQADAETAAMQRSSIEMHLRQACIPYGAAVIYTSIHDKGTERTSLNVELLYRYLMHRLYAYDLGGQAILNSHDALFIPSGWDAEAKLDKIVMEKSFGSVVVPPVQASTDVDQKVETYEALEAFLLRAQGTLQKLGGASAARTTTAMPTPQANGSIPTPVAAAGAVDPAPKDNAALTSFFQNLLTKGGTPIPAGSTGAAAPAAPVAAAPTAALAAAPVATPAAAPDPVPAPEPDAASSAGADPATTPPEG